MIRVADDEQALSTLPPGADQRVLGVVDILKFIDQQMREMRARCFQFQRFGQQIVEVQHFQLPQTGTVGVVQLSGRSDGFRRYAVFDAGYLFKQTGGAFFAAAGLEHVGCDG